MSYTLTNPDQINAYQVIALRAAMKLATKGIKANRQWTNRRGLDTASIYTGQKYKNSPSEMARAISDLTTLIEG